MVSYFQKPSIPVHLLTSIPVHLLIRGSLVELAANFYITCVRLHTFDHGWSGFLKVIPALISFYPIGISKLKKRTKYSWVIFPAKYSVFGQTRIRVIFYIGDGRC